MGVGGGQGSDSADCSEEAMGREFTWKKRAIRFDWGLLGWSGVRDARFPMAGELRRGLRRGAAVGRYGARGWIGKLSYSSAHISRAICSVSYAARNAGLRFRR